MHAGFKLVGRDAEHVGVDIRIEHDGVLLDHGPEHFDLIAQPGRLLEFQFGARLLHVAGQLGDIRFADSAGHHADKLLAHPAMLVSADTVHAWSGAFADRCQQAWTARQLRLVEHVLRACAHGKRLQQRVEAVPKIPYLGVRAEISGIATFAAASHPYAWDAFA